MNNTPTGTRAMSEERADFEAEFAKLNYLWSDSNKNKAFLGWQMARAAIAAQPAELPENETEAMHDEVMKVIYTGGITRTRTNELWQAYRLALASTPVAPARPVAWRIRYRSPAGMIGHYPWAYQDTKPLKSPRPEHEIEPLFATPTQADPGEQSAKAGRAPTKTWVICPDRECGTHFIAEENLFDEPPTTGGPK